MRFYAAVERSVRLIVSFPSAGPMYPGVMAKFRRSTWGGPRIPIRACLPRSRRRDSHRRRGAYETTAGILATPTQVLSARPLEIAKCGCLRVHPVSTTTSIRVMQLQPVEDSKRVTRGLSSGCRLPATRAPVHDGDYQSDGGVPHVRRPRRTARREPVMSPWLGHKRNEPGSGPSGEIAGRRRKRGWLLRRRG